jgi:hypothetical protein
MPEQHVAAVRCDHLDTLLGARDGDGDFLCDGFVTGNEQGIGRRFGAGIGLGPGKSAGKQQHGGHGAEQAGKILFHNNLH